MKASSQLNCCKWRLLDEGLVMKIEYTRLTRYALSSAACKYANT